MERFVAHQGSFWPWIGFTKSQHMGHWDGRGLGGNLVQSHLVPQGNGSPERPRMSPGPHHPAGTGWSEEVEMEHHNTLSPREHGHPGDGAEGCKEDTHTFKNTG